MCGSYLYLTSPLQSKFLHNQPTATFARDGYSSNSYLFTLADSNPLICSPCSSVKTSTLLSTYDSISESWDIQNSICSANSSVMQYRAYLCVCALNACHKTAEQANKSLQALSWFDSRLVTESSMQQQWRNICGATGWIPTPVLFKGIISHLQEVLLVNFSLVLQLYSCLLFSAVVSRCWPLQAQRLR